jgi:predicted nucleic-acid-binding protein
MIGLDTNVLVRYITQDDPVQSPKASILIESFSETEPGFVSLISIVELVWVLQGAYPAQRADIISVLEKLLRVKTLHVEHMGLVMHALQAYASGNADFADCLIERSSHHAGCSRTMTFDRKAAATAGMVLLA